MKLIGNRLLSLGLPRFLYLVTTSSSSTLSILIEKRVVSVSQETYVHVLDTTFYYYDPREFDVERILKWTIPLDLMIHVNLECSIIVDDYK